jgi:hypothetical protein
MRIISVGQDFVIIPDLTGIVSVVRINNPMDDLTPDYCAPVDTRPHPINVAIIKRRESIIKNPHFSAMILKSSSVRGGFIYHFSSISVWISMIISTPTNSTKHCYQQFVWCSFE